MTKRQQLITIMKWMFDNRYYHLDRYNQMVKGRQYKNDNDYIRDMIVMLRIQDLIKSLGLSGWEFDRDNGQDIQEMFRR